MSIKIIFIFGILSLACVQPSFAGNNFYNRLDRYDQDTIICHAFVAENTCSEVASLVRHRNKFEKDVNDEEINEGEPFTRKYFQRGKLRIVAMGYTELLLDTVIHYYLIDQGRLFVVSTQTPHPEEIKQVIGSKLSSEDETPVVYGFLFDKNMRLEKEYSQQGKLHPSIPQSKVDAVLSAYHHFGK